MKQPKQPPEKRYCAYCGRELIPSWGGRAPKFCSDACKTRAYRERKNKTRVLTKL